MRILIDGDGCPKGVKKICEEVAKKFNLGLIIVVDMAHYIDTNFDVITVEQGRDSVDYKIIEILNNNDIVITQDYGLAGLALSKARGVIHTSGFVFTENNINNLLQSRYIGQKIRKAGGRTKGPKKRTSAYDEKFEKCLYTIIEKEIDTSISN